MAGANVDLVRRLLEAFNRGDVDGLEALASPSLSIVPMRAALEDVSYSGPRAIREFWEEIWVEWSTLFMEMDEVEEHADHVEAHGVLRGTARTSGAEVETPVTGTFTIRDGLMETISIEAVQGG